ncbi:MAG TPA: DUF3459 domain-containing protein, partial [Mycobacterium sp.]|nr:DUF3459 domain-containing protein [Mycobacterium sp.]
QGWISVSRGRLRIVCNLGAEQARIPVSGEVVLAWDEPTVDADSTVLQGHSFAILST